MNRSITPVLYRFILTAALLMLAVVPGALAQEDSFDVLTLEALAVLPADTFFEGPASGAFINTEVNRPMNRTVPLEGQPVQGVSGAIPAGNGNWFVLSDNGFGSKGNSADYLLRFYEVAVDFEAGSVEVIGFTQLSDPDGMIPFPIVNEDTEDRLLTGADFDLESFRQAPDGTFWFGEEFGPYLLQTDADGRLLRAPIATPYPDMLAEFSRDLEYIQSPDNPAFVDLDDQDARRAAANLPSSRGFEGMALSVDGTALYPLLEGAMIEDTVTNRLLLQEFDLESGEYTGSFWFYPVARPDHAIGDLTAINENQFLVIERDSGEGIAAAFKRVYLVDLTDVEDDGQTLRKTLVADLLAIYDANGITQVEEGVIGFGPVFKFPFITIESVWPVDANTLLIVNDNNYPFSTGRRQGIEPDDTEFMLLGLPMELDLAE